MNPYPDLVVACNYKRRLDQGKGFHLKNGKRITPVPEVNRDTLYLLINDRLLRISKRSSHGWWSYLLEKVEKEECINELDRYNILWSDICLDNYCVDEIINDSDRASYRIGMTIGDTRYTITNYNCRLIKESTASEVRKILLDHGLLAAIETVGSKSTNQYIEHQYKPSKVNTMPDLKSSSSANKIETTNNQQVSMFELFPSL